MNEKSKCCGGRMIDGIQCEICGSDGRKELDQTEIYPMNCEHEGRQMPDGKENIICLECGEIISYY